MPIDIGKIVAQEKESVIPASSQYDPRWGYYTFSQTIQFEYDDTGTSGLSNVSITINGVFTANSEGVGNETDEIKRNLLFEKYTILRQRLLERAGKKKPSDFSDVGTSRDSRCIQLPSKLLDNTSSVIYAIPVSFYTTEISPEILRYTATFVEPKTTPCKLAIGSDIIDDATVTIVCRKPRITYRNFAFASGSDAYITGIDNRKYVVSGTINTGDGDDFGISKDAANAISNIIRAKGGVIEIQVCKSSADKVVFNMMLTNHTANHSCINGSTNIEISGEETSV